MARAPRGNRALTYLLLAGWSIVCIFPLYWLLVTSFRPVSDIDRGPHYLPFADFAPSLEAWRFILIDSSENLKRSLVNSLIIAPSAAIIAVAAGGMAAYGLTRFDVRLPFRPARSANRGILWGLLATRVLPPVALAVPLYVMAAFVNLLDTEIALILTYAAINLPVAVWLLQPILGPRAWEQEEAARLDGASHMLIFWTILAPMVAGGLAAAGFLIFTLCWNEYLFAATLATDHAATVPVWLVGQLSMKEAQTGGEAEEVTHFAAATVLMLLPPMALAGVIQKLLGRRATWSG
jgi:multiple sugar transport system permease protein